MVLPQTTVRNVLRAVALLAAIVVTAACMYTPKNQERLSWIGQDISFAGYVLSPATQIQLEAKHDDGSWRQFATYTSATVADTDAVGQKWYWWGGVRKLPPESYFWRQSPTERSLQISLRAAQVANGAKLYTFDVGSDYCIDQNQTAGGQAIVDRCKSSQSPVVTMTVPCGKGGEICCEIGSPCDAGKVCNAVNSCQACGGDGQLCCENEACNGGLQCQVDNTCRNAPVTWVLGGHQLYTSDIQESGGDEPYLIIIGFRTRPATPGSTQVFWNSSTGTLANSVPALYGLNIPASQGLVTFPNVRHVSATDVLRGVNPEIIGYVTIAVERDATPVGTVNGAIRDYGLDILKNIIVEQVESRTIPDILTNGVDVSEQSIKDRIKVGLVDGIVVWIESFTDPDDLIGFGIAAYVATDNTIPPPPPPTTPGVIFGRLRTINTGWVSLSDPSTYQSFSGDGATYLVNRSAIKSW